VVVSVSECFSHGGGRGTARGKLASKEKPKEKQNRNLKTSSRQTDVKHFYFLLEHIPLGFIT
jgi:hypothetical protein